MQAPDQNRVLEILGEALELPAAQRAAFLDGACGSDSQLRAEVDRLLDAADAAEVAIPTHHGQVLAQSLAPPTTIGRYQIIRELGHGGMGAVYLGMQHSPVRRTAAIKLLLPGMDTRDVLARFESERQALASMSHPNVAVFYDSGATEIGRPYFVMEFVDGLPITRYCDQQRLTTQQRIELFIAVCEGVQHAHQKAIIHRDLKPTNVLVKVQDGKPVPTVIDFGIAKALDRDAAGSSLVTEHGQLVGTPEYMSPEQADGSRDIDTRTDVYSLGVMLYELLAGVMPFEGNTLRQSGREDLRRIIRQVEPPKPSTRLSGVGAGAARIASARQSDPQAHRRQLRGELDWITMKALEKERSRRYASAAEVAADLRRYLGNEPVLAGPPSTAYRMRKFVSRHRVPVAAAAIVLLALIGGVVGVAWQAVAARRAEARATQRFNDVRTIANKLLFDFDRSIMHVPGTVKARRLLVTTAQEYLDKLARDADQDVNLENDLAQAYMGVGKIQWESAAPNIGDRAGAIVTFKKALGFARHAVSQRPNDPQLRMTLATALSRYGGAACFAEPQAAIEACRESLAIFQSLAQTDLDKRVIEVDVGAALHTLGTSLSDTGKLDDGLAMRKQALEHFTKLHAKRPDDFDVAQWLGASHGMLGRSLFALGRYEEAERELLEGRRVYTELNQVFPSVVTRRSLAAVDSIIGDLRAQQKDFARAAESYAKSVDALEGLAKEDPQDMQARMDFGMNLHRLAELQALDGDNEAAIKTFETRFMPMVQKRYKPGHPKLLGYQLEYAALFQRTGRFADAEALLLTCERDAQAGASEKLPDVVRQEIELYEHFNKPEQAAQARQRLKAIPPTSTQPHD